MKSIFGCVIALSILGVNQGLFVPEQIPSLLSFIYTNIPPIRKGTDSRVGFGFRVGPNADVQVLLELGPQTNTAPLGPQAAGSDDTAGNSKREAIPGQAKKGSNPKTLSWLEAWRNQQMSAQEDDSVGTVKLQPELNKDVVEHLQQLYKDIPQDTVDSRSPPSENSINSRIDTLHGKFRSFRKMKNRLIV